MHKSCFPAWLTLLQPFAYLLAMGASNSPRHRIQGVCHPFNPGFDNPAIMKLLCDYTDIFDDPFFTPTDHVTHEIDFINQTT